MHDLTQVFNPDMPLLEIFVRGTVIYLALFAMLRFLARRQSGGLAIADLLVLVLIADAAQNAMAGSYTSLTDGLLLVSTIVGWCLAIEWLGFRFEAFGRLIRPRAKLLIKNGRPNPTEMRRELLTWDELLSQLRLHGVLEPEEVRCAYLEPTGMISVIRRDRSEIEDPPQLQRMH
jgi:uncharacterized membrane protein YcaP (DUF421 family)